jgi:hypothetical protein
MDAEFPKLHFEDIVDWEGLHFVELLHVGIPEINLRHAYYVMRRFASFSLF